MPGPSAAERRERFGELTMTARMFGERNAGNRRLPALMQAPDTGGNTAGMTHDAAAAGVNEIDGAQRAVCRRRLQRRLSRGEDRHDLATAMRRAEHGCQALAGGGDDRLVALAELVAQTVDVHVVDA